MNGLCYWVDEKWILRILTCLPCISLSMLYKNILGTRKRYKVYNLAFGLQPNSSK